MAKDRVTIQEAARRLAVKDDAIRKRIQRGSLEHEKDENGRVYVYLDATHDGPQGEYHDATRYGRGAARGSSEQGGAAYRATDEDATQDAIAQALRDQIAFLHAELEDRKEEARRKDAIIMSLTQRVPELTPASSPEAPGGSEPATERTSKGDMPPASQEPAEERSWLVRFFFGPP